MGLSRLAAEAPSMIGLGSILISADCGITGYRVRDVLAWPRTTRGSEISGRSCESGGESCEIFDVEAPEIRSLPAPWAPSSKAMGG